MEMNIETKVRARDSETAILMVRYWRRDRFWWFGGGVESGSKANIHVGWCSGVNPPMRVPWTLFS